MMKGTVESVYTEFLGSAAIDSSAGTEIVVDDISVFENVSQVEISETVYSIVSIDENVLTIDTPVAIDAGEEITAFPLVQERFASVAIDSGESATARIPHALDALLIDGDRIETDRESVLLEKDDFGYFVKDVLNKRASVDATVLTGEIPAEALQAKVEPEFSPVPSTVGGLGLILVSWEPVTNLSPVEYDLHVGTIPDFIVDENSFFLSTSASMVSVKTLPDGSPLQYDTDYFFKLVARSGDLKADESITVAGQMNQAGSADIVAGSVTAEKLASTIVLAGEISTATEGARVELSSSKGIESFRPDGSLIAHFPVIPNGEGDYVASLDADAVLRSATVQDRLSIRGQKNEIGKGAILSLTTGTTAPQSSPSVSVGWVTKNFAWLSNRGYNPRGWFYDSGYWYSTESLFGGNWKRYTETPTALVRDKVVALPPDESPIGGIAVIAGKAYVLVQDRKRLNGYFARWYVYQYDVASGAKENEWEYKPYGSDPVESKGYWPTIGVKGSNLIIGQAYKSDKLVDIREYAPTGSVVGARIDTNVTAQNLMGLLYGSFDFGAPRFILMGDDASGNRFTNFKVLNTSGVEQVNDAFPAPVSVDGIGWDASAGVFKSASTETIYRHTDIAWSGASTRVQWVAHSWFDSNAGGTGQHETLISEPVSFVMNKRAAFTLTFPPLPVTDPAAPLDSVTGVRAYHNVTSSTKPLPGAMWRESVDIGDGSVVKQYESLTSTTLYANTGTPTGFPASTPAAIQSSDSPATILLQGDGEATLNKVVSLKDEATSTEWLNAAGTGRLQQPVILVADRNTTALSTANATVTFFNTTHHNIVVNQGGFSRTSVSNVARYFVPTAGTYRVTFRAGFTSNATGRRFLSIVLEGTAVASLTVQATANGNWSDNLISYIKITNPTTEYLEFCLFQNSNGTLATQTGLNDGGQIVIERISD